MRPLLLAAAAMALATLGCRDITPVPSPRVAPASDVISLETSTPHPAAGTIVSITARLRRQAAATAIGSFAATVAYDPAKLEYVGEDGAPGAIGAAKADAAGRVVIAGASAHGFGSGTLFTLRFRVRDPSAIDEVSLSLRELHSVDVHDRRSNATILDGVRGVTSPGASAR